MEKENEEEIVRFALVIRGVRGIEDISYRILFENRGVPESDIILFTECWLEKFKDRFKSNVKNNIFFEDEN